MRARSGVRQWRDLLVEGERVKGAFRGSVLVPYVLTTCLLSSALYRTSHESPAAGHPGRSKTLEPLARRYYWPKMQGCRPVAP